MKKNTQPQHLIPQRRHRSEEFIRFFIAMILGGMLVFFLFRLKIDNMDEQCSTTVYEYITCMPTNFSQSNGTLKYTIDCKSTADYDTLRASREQTEMQYPPLPTLPLEEKDRPKAILDKE